MIKYIPDMRNKVTLRIPVPQNDDVSKINYTDGATVWAAVQPLRGREFWQAQAVQNENIVKITIRYIKNVQSDYKIRFVYEGKNIDYDITNIINIDMRNEYLEIYCKVVE